jgi:hypothetical protein
MKILVLDDQEQRHDWFSARFSGHYVVHARSVSEAISALSNLWFDRVQLDHDLGEWEVLDDETLVERSGMDVVRFITDELPRDRVPGAIVVHSWNPVGAQNMVNFMRDRGITSIHIPYGQ